MTAIAIWRNDEIDGNPSLWAAADSQVSNDNKNPIITDAVKIFSLPIICRRPGRDGRFSEAYFSHTLGYCFAGSTLMGQNTYLGLTQLLSNLISIDSYIPSIEDVSRHVLAYLRETFDGFRHNCKLFEVAIFGYCHKARKLEIYHFFPECQNIWEIVVEPYQNLGTHDFVYLGDDRESINKEINNAFNSKALQGRPISRAPLHVIGDLIINNERPTIGGGLQVVLSDSLGTRPFAIVHPNVLGQPAAYMSYLGRELTDDLTTVGQARVSTMALAQGMP